MYLNRNHSYYHQVQLQLYVSEYRSEFCDFFIYTLKGVLVERILPDKPWQENIAPKLDNYFMEQILPELGYPVHKPGYYL